MQLKATASTHRGRRSRNEDAHVSRPEVGLFAVADGMGGYDGGEVASAAVVGALEDFFLGNGGARRSMPGDVDLRHEAKQQMRAALRLAHRRVLARAHGGVEQMGSTVAALLVRGNHALVAHVGDSRVYRLRDSELEVLTCDHSLWEEIRAAGAEDLVPSPRGAYGHVLTRAISGHSRSEPDFRYQPLRPGDRFLLCSDGLSNVLDDDELAHLLSIRPREHLAADLVTRACDLGASDNVTAVVVDCVQSYPRGVPDGG